MKKSILVILVLFYGFIHASVMLADNVIISGEIIGTEALAPGPSFCDFSEQYPHVLVGPVRVSSSGTYYIIDGAWYGDFYDVTLTAYRDSYDINNPSTNRIGEFDDEDSVVLNSGTDYYFVVQPTCSDFTGVFASTISGPGDISGTGIIQPFGYNAGVFTQSDPVGDISDFQCGEAVYNVSDSFRVAYSGIYTFVDISEFISNAFDSADYVDSIVTFYNGAFDSANPANNRLGSLDTSGAIELQAGVDYLVVAQPYCTNQADRGEWFFILLPPRGLPNHALSGAWFNPATGGQGILLEIYEYSEFVFLAWFTYDTSQPDGGIVFQVGHPGHRWLTAQGNYDVGSGTFTIPVFLITGGIFDDPTAVTPAQEGTISVVFQDCRNATMTYSLTAAGVSGSFSLVRILNDNASYCSKTESSPAPFVN
jgi:hypothetical protein